MATSLFSTLGQRALHTFSSQHYNHKHSRSPTPTHTTDPSNPKLDAFESQLAQKLEDLKEDSPASASASGTGKPLTIGWLCKAMDAVLSTHAAAEAFIPDLRQALGGRGADTKWLDEYLDDSVKLLDTVRALLDVVADMKTYRANVDLVVNTLENRNRFGLNRARVALHRCVDALRKKEEGQGHGNSSSSSRSRLEHCSSMLKRMGEKLRLEDANKGSSIFRVIYASQVTTIFICGVLASALSFKPKPSCPSICGVGGSLPWSQSLRSLQLKVKEHIEKTKSKGHAAAAAAAAFVLDEVNKTDVAVRSLSAKLDKSMLGVKPPSSSSMRGAAECEMDVSHDIVSLRARSIELQTGLAPLEVSIDEVFKVLVTSRVALLNIYSHRKQ